MFSTDIRTLFAGGLPGPVLFGFAIDRSCLLWEKNCDGSTGSCLYYDNHEMAWLMFAVCISCKALCTVFGLLGWRMYICKQRYKKNPKHEIVSQLQSTTIVSNSKVIYSPHTVNMVCPYRIFPG